MKQSERRIYLIQALLKEEPQFRNAALPSDAEEQKLLLRGLMNVRLPKRINEEFLAVQDAYLREETARKGIQKVNDLEPIDQGLYLWQGDITTLRCDAIVNAANSGMTGCYLPNHRCIDNCIHSFSGIQLRLECAEQMRRQGRPEPTGTARLTRAYNLPCKYILHTVGPIVSDEPTEEDRSLLADCYRSCLELAAEKGLESVAFCCISTGEFHFPNEQAAEIAVRAVKAFLQRKTSVEKVVFDVFQDQDRAIYERLLAGS